MLVAQAKQHVGQLCLLRYMDRSGSEIVLEREIIDVSFVPLYGPCLITERDELRLDRVVSIEPIESDVSRAA